MNKYEPVIGLEVHVELKTKTKMFCSCKNDSDEKHPNVNICPICMGHPGTLPVINKEAVNRVIKVGLALNCKIAEITKWDRKNYFYPDLPKGYQISQYDKPICLGGTLETPGFNKKVRITRVHLEEDTGRLIHFGHIGHSLVDFNRAGVPLMELVTEPDFNSGEEASAFAEELRLILRYLGVSDADMEKGQMRVEANISLRPVGSKELGTKVEVKNLNSFKAVRDAVDYEIKRQTEILQSGKKVIQETRGFNEIKGETFSQRIKEQSHDYRYFPEPDLPPLKIDSSLVEEIKSLLPEFPGEKRARFKNQYGLTSDQINIFVSNKNLAGFFENVISELLNWDKEEPSPHVVENATLLASLKLRRSGRVVTRRVKKQKLVNLVANYILGDLSGLLNETSADISETRISAEDFAELMSLIHRGVVTSRAAKDVLKEMWATGKDPSQIVKDRDLIQVKDTGELLKTAQKIINENEAAVSDYKKGKTASLQFMVGQIMKETRGKANPEMIAEILKKLLK